MYHFIFRELPTSCKVDRHLQNKLVFVIYPLSILKEECLQLCLEIILHFDRPQKINTILI